MVGQPPAGGAGASRPAAGAARNGPSLANGAAAAGAGAAAANGAAAGAGGQPPFWANWDWNQFHKQSQELQGQANKLSRELSTKAKSFKLPKKLEMPVWVEMDFLGPQLEMLRETALGAWRQLPPPVQAAMPYLAVSAGTGMIVFHLQQRRLEAERSRAAKLSSQITVLAKENDGYKIVLGKNPVKDRSPNDLRMAAAVANATEAAAQAAAAAANAATAASACFVVKGGPNDPAKKK